jgi:pimeloyl-ACP methyl ester carboxylesterase
MTVLHTQEFPPATPCRGTIVAIPGIAESAETLSVTARHWAGNGFRLLVIDPRGHGQSPRWTEALLKRHPGDVIVEDILADLSELLSGADHPLVLFGHSAGGAAAAAVAASLGARVKAVVLEDPFWRLPVTPFQDRQVAADAAATLRRWQAISDAERQAEIAELFPRWPQDELAAWSKAKADMDVALVAHGDVIPTRAWPTLLGELAGAGVPVKIVTGTIRIGISADHRAIIRSLGAEVTVVPGATHFIRRDDRQLFHALVDGFLDAALSQTIGGTKG